MRMYNLRSKQPSSRVAGADSYLATYLFLFVRENFVSSYSFVCPRSSTNSRINFQLELSPRPNHIGSRRFPFVSPCPILLKENLPQRYSVPLPLPLPLGRRGVDIIAYLSDIAILVRLRTSVYR